MKIVKSILSILALSVLLISSSFATGEYLICKEEVCNEVSLLLDAPMSELSTPEMAKINFFINGDNEIIVISVDAESESIEELVKNKLSHKKVFTATEENIYTLYSINISSEDIIESELSKEVSQLLDSAMLKTIKAEPVQVSYFINGDNEIIVIDVDTNSDSIKNLVKTRLHHKKVSPINESDMYIMFNLKLNFNKTTII